MTRIRLAFLLFGCPFLSFAQLTITGQIVDQDNYEPLIFANILWVTPSDSSKTRGIVSDDNGYFSIGPIPEGEYQLQIQMIGYADKFITVKLNEIPIHLGKISLVKNIANLAEVIVKAERSYLETKPGKRILHVGQDISSVGSTVAEILEWVPSISTTSSGDILLRGSSNFIIYINGKQTNRDARSLRFLNTDPIERIEVITNPSAKYDAEGVSGIINLVYKKNNPKRLKLNGFTNTSLPTRLNIGANISVGNKSFSFYTNLNGGWSWYKLRSDNRRVNKIGRLLSSENVLNYDGQQFQPTLTAGINYAPDSLWTLNFEFNFTRWDAREAINQTYESNFSDQPPLQLRLLNTADELEDEALFSFQINKSFNKGKKFGLLFSVGGETEDNENDYNINSIDLTNSPLAQTISASTSDEQQRYYRLNLDYASAMLNSFIIEMGTQTDFIRFKTVQTQNFHGNMIPMQVNEFQYEVWKPALYGLLKKKWNRLELEAGLRLEYFKSLAQQSFNNDHFRQTSFNAFPSLGVLYKINTQDLHNLGFNFTRRIKTPGFFDINPLVTITDPLNLEVGNPNLRTEFSRLSELIYQKSWPTLSMDITLFHRVTKDVIQNVVNKIDEQRSIRTYANFGRRNLYGTEIQINYQPANTLKFIQNFSWNFSDFSSNEAAIRLNRRGSWQLRITQQIKLAKDWQIDLSEYYRSSRFEPQYEDLAQYYIDFGLRKAMTEKHLVISLNFRDIFDSRLFRSTTFGDDFTIDNSFKFQTRRLILGMQYKFGE